MTASSKFSHSLTIKAKVWLHPGVSPWHFVSLNKRDSAEIKERFGFPRRGFGSIPVEVILGKTIWKTSIFPDKTGVYIMTLKSEIRKKEMIAEGNTIKFELTIIPS